MDKETNLNEWRLKMDNFGLTKERYEQLQKEPFFKSDEQIAEWIRTYGAEKINKGYDFFQCSGSEVIIEGAVVVERIDELFFFETDFDACRQAEKDRVAFINDIPGLEKGCYVDTPENRKHCAEMLEKYPEYRIENWLTPDNSEYYHIYMSVFGETKDVEFQGVTAK